MTYLGRLVERARGKEPAIGGELHKVDLLLMPCERQRPKKTEKDADALLSKIGKGVYLVQLSLEWVVAWHS